MTTKISIMVICSVFLLLLNYSDIYAATIVNYQYDANGNITSGDGKYYEYNAANKLVKVRYGDQSGPVIAEYVYDYTGQRVKKIENGATTYYIGKHYEQQVSNGQTTNTSYYFADNERVAKKDSSGNLFFYNSDHLGGTNVVTNSNRSLIERTSYYPFGKIREGGNEQYTYTGKEKDDLTDWYYFEARYYDPEIMHFAQADTIIPDFYDPQALDRYAYVRNNPLKFIDPNGHSWAGAMTELSAGVISTGGIFFNTFMGGSVPAAADLKQGNVVKALIDLSSGIISGINSFNDAQKHLSAGLLNLTTEKDISFEQIEDIPIVNTKVWKGFSKANDIYGVMSAANDIKGLGNTFQFNRTIYKELVTRMGSKNYSLLIKMINENKLQDAYTIIKTTWDTGNALNENIKQNKR